MDKQIRVIEAQVVEAQRAYPRYDISDFVPQTKGTVFRNGSSESLVLPGAVRFASLYGTFLQSAQEGVAFRYATLSAGQDGLDGANDCQWTRTAALYFKSDGKWHVAFDDIPDAQKNIVLAKYNDGYKSHETNGKFPRSIKNILVKSALKRAEKDGRIVIVPESRLELLTKPISGEDSVAGNTHSRAILGYAAPLQAELLNKEGYEKGRFWFLTLSDLEDLELKSNEAEIRAAGLGRGGGVDAGSRFDVSGCSRGTFGAKEFQRK